MPKRKPVQAFPKLEPQDLLHHPHDKFLKTVLSVRAVAIEWIEFALKPDNFAEIDLESLQLEKGSYLDEKLKPHFADIVWSGRTWRGNPVRISFIFEHKSWRPDKSVVPQLMRYSAASVESDFSAKPPTLIASSDRDLPRYRALDKRKNGRPVP